MEGHLQELWETSRMQEQQRKAVLKSKGPTMDVIYRTIKAQYEFAAAKAVQVENLARSFRELKLGIYISLKFH